MDKGVRTLGWLSIALRIVVGFIGAYCLFSLMWQAVLAVGVLSPGQILGLGGAAIQAIGFLGLAFALALILAMILVPAWSWRAYANLEAASVPGLRYGPVYAAACWFIPFLNLAAPFRLMREIVNRSTGEDEWQAEAPAGDVSAWWACNLAALLVIAAIAVIIAFEVVTGAIVTMPWLASIGLGFLAYLFMGLAALLFFRVVGKVTNAQIAGRHLSQGSVFE